MVSTTTLSIPPRTTLGDAVTTSANRSTKISTTSAGTQISTTQSLDEDTDQSHTSVELDIKTIINIILFTTSLMSLIAILISVMAVCTQKKGSKEPKLTRNELPNLELSTTYTNSMCTFNSYTSSAYDTYSSEKKEDCLGHLSSNIHNYRNMLLCYY